jgi:hypothetical protein
VNSTPSALARIPKSRQFNSFLPASKPTALSAVHPGAPGRTSTPFEQSNDLSQSWFNTTPPPLTLYPLQPLVQPIGLHIALRLFQLFACHPRKPVSTAFFYRPLFFFFYSISSSTSSPCQSPSPKPQSALDPPVDPIWSLSLRCHPQTSLPS